MKNLFDSATKKQIMERINKLDESTSAHWGKMTVGQMCAHCASVLDTYGLESTMARPNFFIRLLTPWVRKTVLGKEPYRKNVATLPQWKQTAPIVFDEGKDQLLKALNYFTNPDRRAEILGWDHPLFGKLTEEESGWAMYKHLDHHLQQFGV